MSAGPSGGASGSSTPSKQPHSLSTSLLSANLAAHLSKPSASSASTSITSATNEPSSHHHHTSAAPAANGIRLPVHGSAAHTGKAPPVAADSAELAISDNDVWKSSAARRAEKAWAIQSEKTLQSDSRFKKYAAAVEKCLATFESVSEWADFIAFLGRLLKTLQTSPHFNAVPRKLIVAKRLSQCLNPALPSGVHQRALEVYEHIFTVLGPEGLRRDLSVWSPGLLPFFQFASTTVKPIVLNIIELHYLPLGQDLRPIAKPLQLALLPGLEEETSEHFDRVLKLLDKVKDSIGQPYFLQNLWLILVSVPAVRLPDLHYLARRLPDLNNHGHPVIVGTTTTSADVTSVVGPDLGLTIRAFSAALEDESLLVRRAMLDILVVKLRLDSATFKTLVRSDDCVRLMQAALGIVLRRDISLNRRLYTWLLGPSEDVETQQKFFEEHAMKWARLALLTEFNSDQVSPTENEAATTGSTDRQRPYRILISLLDKWSLGLPMTNALIVDTFIALKRQLMPSGDVNAASRMPSISLSMSSDVSTTAKMLFEAVDPFAMYRQLFYSACKELQASEGQHASSSSTIDLLRFIFSSFRVHDEESRVVHLPTLFAALVELTLQRPQSEHASATLQLVREVLNLIPKRVFAHRQNDVAVKTVSFVKHGERLYESTSSGADEAAKRYVGFQHPNTIAELLDMCASLPLRNPALAVEALTVLCQLLNILDATIDADRAQAKVTWHGADWIERMKPFLQRTSSFIELEACIEAFVAASQCRALYDNISIQEAGVTEDIVRKLFQHMQPKASPYHVRTVELLWTVADLAPKTPIGALLSRRITSASDGERQDAFDTFGVLWKYSAETRLADPLLVNPLLSILDGLRSTSWLEGQMSERWVRDHAHTYTALLDPLLLMVCDSACLRKPITYAIEGQEFTFLEYRRPIDHEKVLYALSILHQLVLNGGPALARTLRSALVQRSIHPILASQAAKQGSTDATYAQYITDRLQELLQSDPPTNSPYKVAYQAVHALAVDTLSAILQKVQPSEEKQKELETVLLQRLLIDIDAEVLSVQGKTLQTLHSIMSLRVAAATANNAAAAASASSRSQTDVASIPASSPAPPPRLLLPTIKAGLSTRSNRPVLQQWTDFVTAITPIYRRALSPLLLPLNQGVCALVRSAIGNIREAYSADLQQGDAACESSEADVVMLLAISERVLLQSLEQQAQTSGADGSSVAPSSAGGEKGETFSFMGALSNVFSTEPVNASDQASGGTGTNAVWKSLHQTVMTLHLAWLSSGERAIVVDDSRLDTLDIVRQGIRSRCKRYLERLYRHHSGEVVEALVACWHLAMNASNVVNDKSSDEGAETAFEILSFLAPSAQIVVTFLCDVIATRTSSPSSTSGGEKQSIGGVGGASGKHMSSPGVPDVVLQAFLEAYLTRLDATATAQVWPVVTIFVKDIVSNSAQRKAQIYPTMRCLTVIGEKVMDEKNTNDDRRLKRDLIDHYVRICDLSILIAGRSFEQTTWIGRRTVTSEREQDEDSAEKQMNASLGDLSATTATSIEAIQVYLTERVLPALRAFALDADKLSGLSTNIVYYIVAPALRSKRKTADVSATVVALLLELTRMPGTFKTWRTAVAEFFSDSRFFDMDVVAGGERWTAIVLALMTHDKERFVETIGRVSTPSTNIFTNREAETRMRMMNIRRMTYVLFAAPKDYWLTQLPLIQEKLVDVLRNGGAAAIDPAVSEVYLCLRVLLVRFASRHLSGFWPVVITEMMRLFEGCLDELPADGSDALALVEAACRFLDFLVTLQTDEFQVHQWLFITDTVDIVYPPDDWAPEAILDRLATVIGERRAARSAHAGRSSSPAIGTARVLSRNQRGHGAIAATEKDRRRSESSLGPLTMITTSRRKPLLWRGADDSEQPVTRIEELQPFFANISLHAFESTYASGDVVDWDVIETMLKHALFAATSVGDGGEEDA